MTLTPESVRSPCLHANQFLFLEKNVLVAIKFNEKGTSVNSTLDGAKIFLTVLFIYLC
jgi:hypothetical protein